MQAIIFLSPASVTCLSVLSFLLTRADSQLTALKAALRNSPSHDPVPRDGQTRSSSPSSRHPPRSRSQSGQEIDLKRFLETRVTQAPLTRGSNFDARRAAPWMCGVPNPRDAPPPPADAPPVRRLPGETPVVARRSRRLGARRPQQLGAGRDRLRIMQSGLLGPNGSPYSPAVRVGVNVRSVERLDGGAGPQRSARLATESRGLTAAASSEKLNARWRRTGSSSRSSTRLRWCSTLSFSGSGMFAP